MGARARCGFALLLSGLALASAAPARADGRGADGEWSERRSRHFVLLQDVDIDRRSGFHGSVRFERRVLDVLEAAHEQLGERLGLRLERPVEVRIHDPARFDAAYAGLFRFPAAGFYGGVIQIRGDVQVTAGLQRVLHHELVHAAFDALAPSLVLPAWLNEGVAEWFEARALGKRGLSGAEYAALQRAAAGGTLFGLAELSSPSFASFPPGAASLAYLQSYAWVEHLVRQEGEGRLRDFVRDVVRSRRLDRAFRKTYRHDLAELPERFREGL